MHDLIGAEAAGAAMWALVERYTGYVGYKDGVKAESLAHDPPAIDCSGWTALLLSTGMAAGNGALFSEADVAAVVEYHPKATQTYGFSESCRKAVPSNPDSNAKHFRPKPDLRCGTREGPICGTERTYITAAFT